MIDKVTKLAGELSMQELALGRGRSSRRKLVVVVAQGGMPEHHTFRNLTAAVIHLRSAPNAGGR
jgi:hypothetical protein